MISFLPGISFHSFNTPIISLLISIVCIVSYGFVLFFTFFHTYLCKYTNLSEISNTYGMNEPMHFQAGR